MRQIWWPREVIKVEKIQNEWKFPFQMIKMIQYIQKCKKCRGYRYFDGFLKSAFAEMDKDEDGKVTVDEFLKACQAEEDFSKLLSTTAIEIFFEEEN